MNTIDNSQDDTLNLRHSGLPIYAQIAEELRNEIQKGMYQVGDRLPTEAQLSQHFGVNRHTLRRAIAELKNEGLLRVDRGRGTFVAATPIHYTINSRVRYNESLKAQGLEPKMQLLRVTSTEADTAIAKALQLEVGESVALIERFGLANDQPICLNNSYFPLQRFPDFVEKCQDLTFISISKFLQENYNCDHIRQSSWVSTRLVSPHDAQQLSLPASLPVLVVDSINVDSQGHPIEYGVTRFRGDRVELVFDNQS
jgi:GntR family phosphonate transport system transcriptional regulator